jgi:hypothetical protein
MEFEDPIGIDQEILAAVIDRLEYDTPGKGIAFGIELYEKLVVQTVQEILRIRDPEKYVSSLDYEKQGMLLKPDVHLLTNKEKKKLIRKYSPRVYEYIKTELEKKTRVSNVSNVQSVFGVWAEHFSDEQKRKLRRLHPEVFKNPEEQVEDKNINSRLGIYIENWSPLFSKTEKKKLATMAFKHAKELINHPEIHKRIEGQRIAEACVSIFTDKQKKELAPEVFNYLNGWITTPESYARIFKAWEFYFTEAQKPTLALQAFENLQKEMHIAKEKQGVHPEKLLATYMPILSEDQIAKLLSKAPQFLRRLSRNQQYKEALVLAEVMVKFELEDNKLVRTIVKKCCECLQKLSDKNKVNAHNLALNLVRITLPKSCCRKEAYTCALSIPGMKQKEAELHAIVISDPSLKEEELSKNNISDEGLRLSRNIAKFSPADRGKRDSESKGKE